MHERKYGAGKIDKKIVFVGLLWILQSFGRIFFAVLGTPEGMGKFLDTPVSYATSLILFLMFLSLGVFGLIATIGLLTKRKWGFWSTIGVSIATIAFDLWGLTIQSSAAIGFIIPVISILILYPKKSQLLEIDF
ncbi:MAG: hypothetical protein QW220_06205 [Candidatus Bathyarchaeia archaeon]